jgi:hypothetical protein
MGSAIQTTTNVTPTTVFHGHSIVVLVAKSFYTALQNITGLVGLSPVILGESIATIIVLILIFTLIQGIRGKTKFSLEPLPKDE